MFGQEVEDDLGSLHEVYWRTTARELVCFTGESVKRHVLAEQSHRNEQLFCLTDGAAQVVLAVDDEERHVDVPYVAHG